MKQKNNGLRISNFVSVCVTTALALWAVTAARAECEIEFKFGPEGGAEIVSCRVPAGETCVKEYSIVADGCDSVEVVYSYGYESTDCVNLDTTIVTRSDGSQNPFAPFPIGVTEFTITAVDSAQVPIASMKVIVSVDSTTADLAISKTAELTTVKSGKLLNYAIAVSNSGCGTATGVVISDPIPLGSTFVSASPQNLVIWTPPVGGNGSVIFGVPELASGEEVAMELVVKVTARGKTTILNTATVTSDNIDPIPANNSASVQTRIFGQGK